MSQRIKVSESRMFHGVNVSLNQVAIFLSKQFLSIKVSIRQGSVPIKVSKNQGSVYYK